MDRSFPGSSKRNSSTENDNKLFTIGDHSFLFRKKVFVRYVDERPEYEGCLQRWFAARVEGKSADGKKFMIRWYEGSQTAKVNPGDVAAADEFLQPGVLVQTTDIHEGDVESDGNVHTSDYYQEVVILEKHSNQPLAYRVRGKEGKEFSVKMTEMVVDQPDMDKHVNRLNREPPVDFKKLLKGYAFATTHPKDCCTTREELKRSEMKAAELDKRIKKWIVAMGGRLVKDFEELTDFEFTDPKQRFLIAPTHCRTQKYLECLAANVPCIDYHWLKKMNDSRKMVDFGNYRLSRGLDRKGRVVRWTERRMLLDNLRTGFFASSLHGCEGVSPSWWMPVVEAGRGEPVLLAPKKPILEDVDVVVVKSHVPKDIQAMCDEAMVPVVIDDWLIETIVVGKKQPYERYLPKSV